MIRTTTSALAGLGLALAALGCSTPAEDNMGTNPGNQIPGAGTGAPLPGTAGTPAPGSAGSSAVPVGPLAGNGVVPGAGTGALPTAGAGVTPPAGGTDAMAMGGTGGMATGGTGGTGTPSGTCDKSTFLSECLQGGAQWGTPQQAGPCSHGTTVYGVTKELGPYGVRSEYNVGEDFHTGNTALSDFGTCSGFIDSFGADPVGSADLKNTHDLDFGLFTVFYPGCMPEGEKFPVVTWANGTCAMPEGYGPLLRNLASYGYIVVAANSVQTLSGAQQRAAIDFIFAENEDSNSKYYQHVDTEKVGAMGHSQGGSSTVAAASDARIDTVILFNGGTSAAKPFLAISGDNDLFTSVSSYRSAVMAAPRPAAWLWYHQVPQAVNGSTTGAFAPGHLTLMMESERVNDVTVAWFDMMLKEKQEAKAMFVGSSCTLCDGSAFPSMWPPFVASSATAIEYGANAMLQ